MDVQTVLDELLASFLAFIPRILAAITIFIATLLGSNFVTNWVKKISERKIANSELLQLITRVIRWTLIAIGTVMALSQVNFDVTGFIAGLGIAGFTIGFALQDIAKNFISGLLLLYRQPFIIGDNVSIADYRGMVLEINVRDTVLETMDGERVIIPNREVFENPILNYSHSRLRRRNVMIGLGYEEDSERAIAVFLDAIKAVPGVEKTPGPTVWAESLGDSTLTLSVLFWVDQQENELFGVHSAVVQAIKIAAEDNQIDLPYPVQTVRLEKVA